MATITRQTTLRVVSDNVDLGGGISLPMGDYSGTVTEMIIMMRGREIRQVSRVAIYFSSEALTALGLPPKPGSIRTGIEADFAPSFLKGDIVEV